jgi:hypothetical protein
MQLQQLLATVLIKRPEQVAMKIFALHISATESGLRPADELTSVQCSIPSKT